MPTSKRKTASRKTTAKRAPKAPSAYSHSDYSLNLVSFILYVWEALIIVFTVLSVSSLVNAGADTPSASILFNLLVVAILLILSLLVFRAARSLSSGSDDGYMAAVVIFINMAIFGFQGVGWGINFNVASYIFFAIAVLGMILLVPYFGKVRRADSHNLTTWSLVLHILFWFVISYIGPMLGSNV